MNNCYTYTLSLPKLLVCNTIVKLSNELRAITRPIALVLLRTSTSLFFIILLHSTALSQINFGSFGVYTIQLTDISVGSLTFEGISGSGELTVVLSDAFVVQIEGVKYLDVGVLITADGVLLLGGDIDNIGDPQKSITFTLEAAYANKGQQNTGDAELITIISNVGDARFPILARQFQPPGPPPPPPTAAFDQAAVEGAAYLYLYGKIDVGNVDAGTYTGNINISVQYDNPPAASP